MGIDTYSHLLYGVVFWVNDEDQTGPSSEPYYESINLLQTNQLLVKLGLATVDSVDHWDWADEITSGLQIFNSEYEIRAIGADKLYLVIYKSYRCQSGRSFQAPQETLQTITVPTIEEQVLFADFLQQYDITLTPMICNILDFC